MKKQPLFILCLCFISGIILQEFCALQKSAVLAILLIGIVGLFSQFSNSIKILRLRDVFLGIFFVSVGIYAHSLREYSAPKVAVSPKEKLIFKIDKKLNSTEKTRKYEATVFKDKTNFSVVVSVPKSLKEFDFKHYYQAEVYLNPVMKPANAYQFDYSAYLARKNIFYQMYISGSVTAADKEMGLQDKVRQKRLEILQKIGSTTLSPRTKEFLKGLILADRTEMDAEVTQDFTRSGLVHFLAISGTHMVVIFWFLQFLLKPVFGRKCRNLPIILSVIFIWIFAVFIGYGSSVMRSCLMITVYYGFVLLQRKPDLLHAMAVAAFLILAFDTHQLFDVGFQLSFIAVFGIYWLNQPILKILPYSRNKILRFLTEVAAVTLAAQLITLPLILYYFHQFSLISIVANLFIVPLSEVVIVFSLLMVAGVAVFGNLPFIGVVYDFTVQWLLKGIHFFAGADSVFYDRIPMSFAEAVLLFIAILCLRKVFQKHDSESIAKFSLPLLLFFALRLSLNFASMQKDEVAVHDFYKDKIISVKQGGRVYFWLPTTADTLKVQKYIINPYLVYTRATDFKVEKLPENAAGFVLNGKDYPLK